MNYLQKKKLAFMSIVNRVKGFVRTAVGVPPLVLPDCVGDNLINYSISGNSVQDGTPTPDNPVEVESVGEYDETTGKYKIPIKVRGKNLFNVDVIGTLGTYGDFIQNGDGTITVSSYPSGTKETLSQLCPDLKAGDNLIVTMETEGVEVIQLTGTKKTLRVNTSYTITQEDLDGRVCFYCRRVDGVNYPATISKIQFQLGEVGDYEPYVEPTETSIYLDEPLRKIGDYADYIDFENGKVVRNVSRIKLTRNNPSVTPKPDRLSFLYNRSLTPNVIVGNKKSTHFELRSDIWGLGITDTTTNGMFANTTELWIRFPAAYASDFYPDYTYDYEKFYAWLDDQDALGNPVYIDYAMSTPTEEDIDLPQIPTFKGTTVLSPSTAIKPSSLSATYYSTSKE